MYDERPTNFEANKTDLDNIFLIIGNSDMLIIYFQIFEFC